MGIFSGLFGGIGKAAEGIGNAVNKNYKTIKGDKSEEEKHVHDEQMAVLSQFAAEFAGRPPKTKWDSFVDGLNRLPRPILTFGIIGFFCWSFIDPGGFVEVVSVLEIVPAELWSLFMLVVGFFFGGRFVKEDLARPKLTDEQRKKALEIIEKRAEALDKAAEPDSIIALPHAEPTIPPAKLPDLPPDTNTAVAIDIMIENLIHREGGYVNHPADRGGPTAFGITMATLADWRGCPVTIDDVRALKRTEASEIYRAKYFFGPNIDGLPVPLQAHVMDCAVNHGARTALRLLQRTLNGMGERLAVDGVIGPETRDACRKYDAGKINDALVFMRLRFYDDIVANDDSQRVFLAGWQRRARSFSTGPGIAA